jgi:hypothetical protein
MKPEKRQENALLASAANRRLRAAAIWLLLLASIHPAWAESVMTIVNNGDPLNRVDLAVLGDGYTADEMDKYAADVQQAIDGLFAQEPFLEYQRYFNVHRIDVISNQSGADHPELDPPVYVDTAFDAAYNCAGIVRLICVDGSKVLTVVQNSLQPAQADLKLVIVNDPQYGGSGFPVASTHPWLIELVLHELGHSFGGLGDEYVETEGRVCDLSDEPSLPNITKETERELIKWNYWIEPNTPIPTATADPGVPGLYEGVGACVIGLFRPTYSSKMRYLDMPFEQINTEQIVKRVYNLVSPLDASEPAESDFALELGRQQGFTVSTPSPLTHGLTVTWLVDDLPQGGGLDFILDTTLLDRGPHTVQCVVEDPTPMVRQDPAELLSESRIWNVTVGLHAIALVPTSLDFGSQGVGSTSSPQTVTLSNTGNAVLTIPGIATTGDFAQSHDCGTSVAAAASCSINVTFTPTTTGNRTGSLTISSDALGSPHTVALSGMGTDFTLNVQSGGATSATVSAGSTATFNLQVEPTGFVGNVAVSCAFQGSTPRGASCSVTPTQVTLNGTDPGPFTVKLGTTARSLALPRPDGWPPLSAPLRGVPLAVLLLGLLTVVTVAVPRRRSVYVGLVASMLCVVVWVACGGGGGGGGTPALPQTGTPAGTYTLTVTGTSSGASRSTALTLKVN